MHGYHISDQTRVCIKLKQFVISDPFIENIDTNILLFSLFNLKQDIFPMF